MSEGLVEIIMADLSSINFSNLYCLFKGEPGTRKSTCALSFPKPQYWFSFDRKMDGIILPMINWGYNPKDIVFDDYIDWEPARQKLEGFRTTFPYKTLVVDSITSGADAILRQTRRIKGMSGQGKSIAGIPTDGYDEFNAESSALGELIALTKDISKYHKINVVLIAHVIQKEMKSPDGKTHMARLLVTAGKAIAQKIPAYCSEVYHFNIKTTLDGGGKYALMTQHTGDDFARTSLKLPNEIIFGDEPLYDKWIKPAIDVMNSQNVNLNANNQQSTIQQPTNKFGV